MFAQVSDLFTALQTAIEVLRETDGDPDRLEVYLEEVNPGIWQVVMDAI